jgi:hypothetical protein
VIWAGLISLVSFPWVLTILCGGFERSLNDAAAWSEGFGRQSLAAPTHASVWPGRRDQPLPAASPTEERGMSVVRMLSILLTCVMHGPTALLARLIPEHQTIGTDGTGVPSPTFATESPEWRCPRHILTSRR